MEDQNSPNGTKPTVTSKYADRLIEAMGIHYQSRQDQAGSVLQQTQPANGPTPSTPVNSHTGALSVVRGRLLRPRRVAAGAAHPYRCRSVQPAVVASVARPGRAVVRGGGVPGEEDGDEDEDEGMTPLQQIINSGYWRC